MLPITASNTAVAVLFIAEASKDAVSTILPGIDVVAFVKYCDAALGALLEYRGSNQLEWKSKRAMTRMARRSEQ
jgi:hypothetical protein